MTSSAAKGTRHFPGEGTQDGRQNRRSSDTSAKEERDLRKPNLTAFVDDRAGRAVRAWRVEHVIFDAAEPALHVLPAMVVAIGGHGDPGLGFAVRPGPPFAQKAHMASH